MSLVTTTVAATAAAASAAPRRACFNQDIELSFERLSEAYADVGTSGNVFVDIAILFFAVVFSPLLIVLSFCLSSQNS